MRFTGFIGPSYTLQSVNVDCQQCINLYPELDEMGTGKEREVAALIGTPGLRKLATIGSGPIRGLYTGAQNGVLYVVSGGTLYSVDSAWSPTTLGSLNTTTGFVSMADNGSQLVSVDGAFGYKWDLSALTFAQISDPNFYASNIVVFQDQYLIFCRPNTQQFFISGLDAVTFNGLDLASAEALPDYLIGVMTDQRNLYLLGQNSVEIWYDSGAAAFPFERMQGSFIPVGCESAASIQRLDGSVYWLGRSEAGRGIVYRTQGGYQHERISTHAIEFIIRQQGDLTNSRAWSYQQGGHAFYCLNIPGASTTLCFDATTKLWHERAYLSNGNFGRHLADCHAFAYSTNVVGDYTNGNIYALDPATFSDNGSPLAAQRTAPHITKDLDNIVHSEFQLDVEGGVGLVTGQGSSPQAMLQFSDDGGHRWSNEKWTSLGAIGATKARARWQRLGCARDRVYRIRITDPVKRVMIGARIRTIGGNT